MISWVWLVSWSKQAVQYTEGQWPMHALHVWCTPTLTSSSAVRALICISSHRFLYSPSYIYYRLWQYHMEQAILYNLYSCPWKVNYLFIGGICVPFWWPPLSLSSFSLPSPPGYGRRPVCRLSRSSRRLLVTASSTAYQSVIDHSNRLPRLAERKLYVFLSQLPLLL